MTQHISRRVDMGFPQQLFAAMAYLLSLPRPAIFDTDAIVVFPGLGEWERITAAIKLWQHPSCRARFLLIEGHNTREITTRILTIEALKEDFGLTKTNGVHITTHAEHTLEQATHVAEMITTLGITSITLCVPPYHATRAYLTLLEAIRESKLDDIPILPAPTPCGPGQLVPEFQDEALTAWDMSGGEHDRIDRYRETQPLFPSDIIRKYVVWLYQQPLISRYLCS